MTETPVNQMDNEAKQKAHNYQGLFSGLLVAAINEQTDMKAHPYQGWSDDGLSAKFTICIIVEDTNHVVSVHVDIGGIELKKTEIIE